MKIREVSTEDDIKPSTSGGVLFPEENKYGHIKNKEVRNRRFHKIKQEHKKVVCVYGVYFNSSFSHLF